MQIENLKIAVYLGGHLFRAKATPPFHAKSLDEAVRYLIANIMEDFGLCLVDCRRIEAEDSGPKGWMTFEAQTGARRMMRFFVAIDDGADGE